MGAPSLALGIEVATITRGLPSSSSTLSDCWGAAGDNNTGAEVDIIVVSLKLARG